MKICHVICSNGSGGAERVVVDTAVKQSSNGHEVFILAAASSVRDVDKKRLQEVGCEYRLISGSRFSRAWVVNVRRLSRRGYLMHAHLFPAFYYVALCAKGALVVTEHSPTNNRRNKLLFRMLETLAYRRYKTVVCVSNDVQHRLCESFPAVASKTCVVFNGVPASSLSCRYQSYDRQRLERGEIVLIVVGNLAPRKQFDMAIEAISVLPDSKLVVVGDGPSRGELERLANRIAPGRVQFLGHRDDPRQFVANADVLLVTSLYEGFGLVAVEAMSVGTPVVANNIPGLNEVVREGGVLYGNGGPGIVECVERVAENWPEYSKAAFLNADLFSFDRYLREIDSVYSEIVFKS